MAKTSWLGWVIVGVLASAVGTPSCSGADFVSSGPDMTGGGGVNADACCEGLAGHAGAAGSGGVAGTDGGAAGTGGAGGNGGLGGTAGASGNPGGGGSTGDSGVAGGGGVTIDGGMAGRGGGGGGGMGGFAGGSGGSPTDGGVAGKAGGGGGGSSGGHTGGSGGGGGTGTIDAGWDAHGGNGGGGGTGGSDGGVAGAAGTMIDAGVDAWTSCRSNIDCPSSGLFCNKISCDNNAQGVCRARPQDCGNTQAVVCGCDGVNYWNDCFRQREGVAAGVAGQCADTTSFACGGSQGVKCPVSSAYCGYLWPSQQYCSVSGRTGACWVLPAQCPPVMLGGDYRDCNVAGSVCLATCDAIKKGNPFYFDSTCPH